VRVPGTHDAGDAPAPGAIAAATIYAGAVLRRTLPLALALIALLAGCGGSEDTGPQTKEGFILAADGVCQNLSSDLAAAGSTNPQTPQQVADANNVLADLYGKLVEGLVKVRLPDTGAPRRQAQAFVASVRTADPPVERLRTASKDFVTAAKTKDRQATATAGNEVRSALDAFRAARANSDRLAIGYGMNVCGNLG
jgi:phage tail protein X